MKRLLFVVGALLCITFVQAQSMRIAGYVKDSKTMETLPGAHVLIEGTQRVEVTDKNGFFSIKAPVSSSIVVSYTGYQNVHISNLRDTVLQIFMESGQALSAVDVTAFRSRTPMKIRLSMDEVRNLPTLGAKPDILKALQFMPGVQSTNEGSSAMVVRGGNPGENLYLLDKIPLIYVNHIGGLLSVFNPEMINDLTFYKGAFPAQYGSKLSSIVDITQKSGDRSQFKGGIDVGLTDLAFRVEGPALGDKASYIITGRKTMIEPLMLTISGITASPFMYGFYDVNGKFSWDINQKHRLSLNVFQGDDYMVSFEKSNKNQTIERALSRQMWGNTLAGLTWDYLHSERLKGSQILSYTRYRVNDKQSFYRKTINKEESSSSTFLSDIQNFSLRSDWNLYWGRNASLNFGAHLAMLSHLPHRYYQSGKILDTYSGQTYSTENALYAENKATLWKRLETSIGVRLAHYQKGDYFSIGLEPRIELGYHLNSKMSIFANYMRTGQNSHLVYTPGSIMNNEVWIPSTEAIPVASSDQLELVYNVDILPNLRAEVGAYYKTFHRLAAFKDGYVLQPGDQTWESKILSGGEGYSYGTEWMLRGNFGAFSGMLSYTYSRSFRQFKDLNQGAWFPFEYDRPHQVTLTGTYVLNDRWTFNAAWSFQSGLPFTPAVGRKIMPFFEDDGTVSYEEVVIYGQRNSDRMKAYHRLDLSARYSYLSKRGNRAAWTFSIYNAYAQKNPYYYYYSANGGEDNNNNHDIDQQPMGLYQVSFFPLIPSFSYSVYFDAQSGERRRERQKIKQMFKD